MLLKKRKKNDLLLHYGNNNNNNDDHNNNNDNNNNINDLPLPCITLILKTHVFYKDENNTKSLTVLSDHAFSSEDHFVH